MTDNSCRIFDQFRITVGNSTIGCVSNFLESDYVFRSRRAVYLNCRYRTRTCSTVERVVKTHLRMVNIRDRSVLCFLKKIVAAPSSFRNIGSVSISKSQKIETGVTATISYITELYCWIVSLFLRLFLAPFLGRRVNYFFVDRQTARSKSVSIDRLVRN